MLDRLCVFVDEDHDATFRVQGIFDLGAKDVNLRWVLVPLRAAQTLFDLSGGVSLIEARVDDIFAATTIAAVIAAHGPGGRQLDGLERAAHGGAGNWQRGDA